MSTNLNGITGGTSNGSTTVTVTTDSPAGYSLSIKSANSPALQNGVNTIPDYNQGVDADYSFLVSGGAASFGFSPSSVDVVTEFKDNTSLCGVGTSATPLACLSGLMTTDIQISE